jgi:hypothetical protein
MPDPTSRLFQRATLRRKLRAADWRRALSRRGMFIALIIGLVFIASGMAAAQQAPSIYIPPQPQHFAVDQRAVLPPSLFDPPQRHPVHLPAPQSFDPSSIGVGGSSAVPGSPPLSVETAVPGDCETSIATRLATAPDYDACWEWQILPDGLIYRSYLAGFKEPRLHSFWAFEQDLGWIWDIALGGRVGIVRYGDRDDAMPDGWQIDLEGAGFPRLDPEEDRDLVAVDFRAGVPITYGAGPHRTKIAYYHLSSHLGDEFLLKNPTVPRFNYSRDVLVWGQSYYATPDLRIYGEAGWAFYSDVSGEWEFQFGVDYSPVADWGFRGSPFAAFNGHLREEVDFGGNLVAQLGWQWRQPKSGHLLRLGVEYFNGKSDQFEFFDRYENKIGLALWYDF